MSRELLEEPILEAYTSYDRRAPSARVRLFDWLDYLKIAAHTINPGVPHHSAWQFATHAPSYASHAIRVRRQTQGGAAFIQREVGPFGKGAVEARILEETERGVYDFDDALFLHRGGFRAQRRARWQRAVEAADHVIAANGYLAEAALGLNNVTAVIPSCVRSDLYRVKQDYDSGKRFEIVWVGSASTEVYLSPVIEAVAELNSRRPARITLVGRSGSKNADPRYIRRVKWREGLPEASLYRYDLGIMPLSPSDWEKGKAAYKLLQYGAAGLPVAGSPVGVTGRLLADWSAPLAGSSSEWLVAIQTMMEDAGERARIGQTALQAVRRDYSFAAHAGAWTRIVFGTG